MKTLEQSLKLAQLWHRLRSIQLEINNELLPIIAHLEVDKEDAALATKLEEIAQAIAHHFAHHRLEVAAIPTLNPQLPESEPLRKC